MPFLDTFSEVRGLGFAVRPGETRELAGLLRITVLRITADNVWLSVEAPRERTAETDRDAILAFHGLLTEEDRK